MRRTLRKGRCIKVLAFRTIKEVAADMGYGIEPKPEHAPPSLKRKDLSCQRILVVEDEYLIASDLCRELSERGADVIGPFGRLDQALEKAELQIELDAAVVDINLHGEFAFPLLDNLVQREIPVVISTGYHKEVLPYRLRHLTHLTKPTAPSEVAQAVADNILELRLHKNG